MAPPRHYFYRRREAGRPQTTKRARTGNALSMLTARAIACVPIQARRREHGAALNPPRTRASSQLA